MVPSAGMSMWGQLQARWPRQAPLRLQVRRARSRSSWQLPAVPAPAVLACCLELPATPTPLSLACLSSCASHRLRLANSLRWRRSSSESQSDFSSSRGWGWCQRRALALAARGRGSVARASLGRGVRSGAPWPWRCSYQRCDAIGLVRGGWDPDWLRTRDIRLDAEGLIHQCHTC